MLAIRSVAKNTLFSAIFFRNANSTEHTSFTRVLPSGTHYSAESTEEVRIKSLDQGHNMFIQPGL